MLQAISGTMDVQVAVAEPVTNPANRESYKGISITAGQVFNLSTDIATTDAISVRVVQADGTIVPLARTNTPS